MGSHPTPNRNSFSFSAERSARDRRISAMTFKDDVKHSCTQFSVCSSMFGARVLCQPSTSAVNSETVKSFCPCSLLNKFRSASVTFLTNTLRIREPCFFLFYTTLYTLIQKSKIAFLYFLHVLRQGKQAERTKGEEKKRLWTRGETQRRLRQWLWAPETRVKRGKQSGAPLAALVTLQRSARTTSV